MKMQVLVDGEWVDVAEPREFTFTTDEQEDEPSEPVPTQQSWSMDFSMKPEDSARLHEQIERWEREARWASRLWLRYPVRL